MPRLGVENTVNDADAASGIGIGIRLALWWRRQDRLPGSLVLAGSVLWR